MKRRIDRSRSPSPIAVGEQTPMEQSQEAASRTSGGMTVQSTQTQVASLITPVSERTFQIGMPSAQLPSSQSFLDRTRIVPVGEPSTSTGVTHPPTGRKRRLDRTLNSEITARLDAEFSRRFGCAHDSNKPQKTSVSVGTQAGSSRVHLATVADDDPLSKYCKSAVEEAKRSSTTEVPDTKPTEFDNFITGGPFPNLSDCEKSELEFGNLSFKNVVQPAYDIYGEYHIAACPFVPIGTKHLVHLVPADDLESYRRIAQLWVQMQEATLAGDSDGATQTRDQLTAYINDPRGYKMKPLEAIRFQSDSIAKFIEVEVLEKILDTELDYFSKAHADPMRRNMRRKKVGFTLLYLRDKIRPSLNQLTNMCLLPSQDWNEDNNPVVFFQVENKRLTLQGKNPIDTREIAKHMMHLITHLLEQDYVQARISQQYLLEHRDAFNLGDMMAALESASPTATTLPERQ